MIVRPRPTLSRALPMMFLPALLVLAACARPFAHAAQSTPTAVPPTSSASPTSTASPASPASPVAVAPSFPDLSRGNAQTTAKLLSFDASARSAVVEPVIFMDGGDYCAHFHIATSDPRCIREWVTEDSNIKVTLPVDAHAKLTTVRGGDPDCMGGTQVSGTCPLTPAGFASLAKQSPGMLVRVTVKNGSLTQLAEQFIP
jgi:hypothetical protein